MPQDYPRPHAPAQHTNHHRPVVMAKPTGGHPHQDFSGAGRRLWNIHHRQPRRLASRFHQQGAHKHPLYCLNHRHNGETQYPTVMSHTARYPPPLTHSALRTPHSQFQIPPPLSPFQGSGGNQPNPKNHPNQTNHSSRPSAPTANQFRTPHSTFPIPNSPTAIPLQGLGGNQTNPKNHPNQTNHSSRPTTARHPAPPPHPVFPAKAGIHVPPVSVCPPVAVTVAYPRPPRFIL